MELGVDAETVEKSSSIGLCFPSVHFCILTLKLAGTDAIFVCEIFLSGQLEPTKGDIVITPGQRLSFLQQNQRLFTKE